MNYLFLILLAIIIFFLLFKILHSIVKTVLTLVILVLITFFAINIINPSLLKNSEIANGLRVFIDVSE